MKLTQFKLTKLKWLLQNPAFKAGPVSVIRRILVWEWVRLADRPMTADFDGSHPIVLRPNEGASRLTYYFGNSEPETFAFMDSYLKHGMCVIDVGANIGLNTIYVARRVGESGKVFAIEPDPANFNRIRENLGSARLPQVELFEAACGCDSSARVKVHSNEEDSSRSFVSTCSTAVAEDDGVPVITIDELVKTREIDVIDYLKIDVEGFEEQVLRGALRSIAERKVRVLHVELDPDLLSRGGASVSGIIQEMEALGLRSCQWSAGDSSFHQMPKGNAGYYGFFVLPELLEQMEREF